MCETATSMADGSNFETFGHRACIHRALCSRFRESACTEWAAILNMASHADCSGQSAPCFNVHVLVAAGSVDHVTPRSNPWSWAWARVCTKGIMSNLCVVSSSPKYCGQCQCRLVHSATSLIVVMMPHPCSLADRGLHVNEAVSHGGASWFSAYSFVLGYLGQPQQRWYDGAAVRC